MSTHPVNSQPNLNKMNYPAIEHKSKAELQTEIQHKAICGGTVALFGGLLVVLIIALIRGRR